MMKLYSNTPYFCAASALRMKAFNLSKFGQFKCATCTKFILSLVLLLGMTMSTLKAVEVRTPADKPTAFFGASETGPVPNSITTYSCAPVAVEIVNPDFEILYKAGSTTVTSPPLTNWQNVLGPDNLNMTGPTVTFSDNTTGNEFNMAGWTFNTLMGVTNFNAAFPSDPRDIAVWMNGNFFGGGTAEKTMSQILEEDVQQNFTYTLTADFGWRSDNAGPSPPVLRFYAGATLLTPVTSADPPLVQGGFVTYSRTYYIDDASISGPLRIEFGLAANTDGRQLNTDRIRLTKTPDDCQCDPGSFAVTTEINGETLITGCQPCPAGSYCPDGVYAFLCPPGFFSSNLGSIVCSACPVGTANPFDGAELCIACPVGTYSDIEGAAACQDCDAGFNSGVGAAECFPDADGDGIEDSMDNCPFVYNPDQADTDFDGVGDVCDNCVYTANPGQEDDDCDGVGNVCDMCPGGDDTVDNNNDGLPDCFVYPGAYYLPAEWSCSNNSNNEKVRICHNGNTICVSENAIPAFIENGGYIGPCDNANCDEIVPFLNNGTTHLGMDGVTDFSFFPNPASGQVNIDLYNITTPSRLLVMDARGMIIVSRALDVQTTGRVELDAANWASGLYMISLHSGDISLTQRLIIQH